MNVEYTGRQYEITPTIRRQAELGLAKLTKILGPAFDSHVILSAEKHRCIAEITVTARGHAVVGLAEAGEMVPALSEALDRIECQVVKYKARWRSRKRQARRNWVPEIPAEERRMAAGAAATSVPIMAHNFPAHARTAEAHVIRSRESVAMRPMTLEEAIKEAEFRDRDVFVFRDMSGKIKVLHRTREGKIELIEAP